uniref:Serpentine receptor class gamma n=1 Tax=Bursaphelenchus xylophilus TaxID=6326 RepID=A0A1I7S899_BURXY
MWATPAKLKLNFLGNGYLVCARRACQIYHSSAEKKTGYTTRTFKFVIYPLTLVVGSICTFKCYQFQNNPSNKFSERTKQMYHLLILGLVIEMLAEFFWFIIPYVCVPIYLPVEKQIIGYYVVYRMFYAYPSFVMIFTLVFYKRYNTGVREIFGFIRENFKMQNASVSDPWTGGRTVD